jgi:hypothetical protein
VVSFQPLFLQVFFLFFFSFLVCWYSHCACADMLDWITQVSMFILLHWFSVPQTQYSKLWVLLLCFFPNFMLSSLCWEWPYTKIATLHERPDQGTVGCRCVSQVRHKVEVNSKYM